MAPVLQVFSCCNAGRLETGRGYPARINAFCSQKAIMDACGGGWRDSATQPRYRRPFRSSAVRGQDGILTADQAKAVLDAERSRGRVPGDGRRLPVTEGLSYSALPQRPYSWRWGLEPTGRR